MGINFGPYDYFVDILLSFREISGPKLVLEPACGPSVTLQDAGFSAGGIIARLNPNCVIFKANNQHPLDIMRFLAEIKSLTESSVQIRPCFLILNSTFATLGSTLFLFFLEQKKTDVDKIKKMSDHNQIIKKSHLI